jgi:hypothetical protein
VNISNAGYEVSLLFTVQIRGWENLTILISIAAFLSLKVSVIED